MPGTPKFLQISMRAVGFQNFGKHTFFKKKKSNFNILVWMAHLNAEINLKNAQ